MKEPFYQTFRKGEAHYEERDRLDVNAWLANLREYKNLLTNGKYAEQDALSLEIFPNRYKHIEPNADAKSPQQTKTWGHSTPHTKSGAKQSKSPEKRPSRKVTVRRRAHHLRPLPESASGLPLPMPSFIFYYNMGEIP